MYKFLTLLVTALVIASAQVQPGPYQPSGWRPLGPEFKLPVPHSVYGPPEEFTTTAEPEITTTEEPTTTEVVTEAEDFNSVDGDQQFQELTEQEEQGVYYVYHPSGLLQRVLYATNNDKQNMAYSAKLKYENVQPITVPIFTYDSDTLQLKRIN